VAVYVVMPPATCFIVLCFEVFLFCRVCLWYASVIVLSIGVDDVDI